MEGWLSFLVGIGQCFPCASSVVSSLCCVFANEIDRVVVFHEHVVEVLALFFFALDCVAVSFNAVV